MAETDKFEDECPGVGLCHGCLRWCSYCGDVAHICDARLRDERCTEHPVPPPAGLIRTALRASEVKIAKAKRDLADGKREL
jgi:hypothetical protein